MSTSSSMPEAALLIIGNEILSGRTRDTNLGALTAQLRQRGVRLAEARVVRDRPAEIVAAVNTLRRRYGTVFTSGGIGPTHDDITTACVAAAFEVPVVRSEEAVKRMTKHYEKAGSEATEMRLRMADIPEGAELIFSELTPAPGYRIDNVVVLAGVPAVFASMAAQIARDMEGGPQLLAANYTVEAGESSFAAALGNLQDEFADLEIGCYPQSDNGRYYAEVVITGIDAKLLDKAGQGLGAALDKQQIKWRAIEQPQAKQGNKKPRQPQARQARK